MDVGEEKAGQVEGTTLPGFEAEQARAIPGIVRLEWLSMEDVMQKGKREPDCVGPC